MRKPMGSGEERLPGLQEVPGKGLSQKSLGTPRGTVNHVQRFNDPQPPGGPGMPIMPRIDGNNAQWNDGQPKTPSSARYTHAPYGPKE